MITGLDWRTLHLPLAAGVDQSADARALQSPALAIAKDLQLEERGGIQTRPPFTAAGSDIFGGGTLSNIRRAFAYGDERMVATKDTLYAWNAALSKWVSRGTHLAVAVDEEAVFTTTGDQRDCDRAELAGVMLTAWVDAEGLWVGARDKTTGSVLMAPTLANNLGTRPRLVALSTKILLFAVDTAANDLEVLIIDPAAPATGIGGGFSTVLAGSGSYYDVVKIPGADTAIGAVRRAVTTSFTAFKYTAGGSLTTNTYARTCDGPIAVSCEPTGTSVQIIRANGTNIQGDRVTISSLADAATGQAVGTATGTPVNQIAAAHRSVQDSSAYRCYAFWSAEESTGTVGFSCKYNFVDTAGTIGTQATLGLRLGVASRAFDYNGQVFVWLAFAGESQSAGMGEPLGIRAQLQDTYFLYRDDATLHGRSVWQRAGGFSPSTGRLPGVALTSGSTTYSWCGTERRVIPLGIDEHTSYADRGPVDVAFTFDDDRARRVTRIGRTLYISGSIIMQYDGEGLTECGFLVYPWYFAAVQSGAGSIPDGRYSYQATYRWANAQGETERSTTATGEQITLSGGPAKVDFSVATLAVTLKQGTRRPPAIEIWRTQINPPVDAPFYLDTSNDPGVLSGDNRYIPNAPTSAFASDGLDNLTDTLLGKREAHSENDGLLESLAPPPATIIVAYGTRVFLGGIAGQPHRIWYSRHRGNDEIASFHDGNVIDLPPEGGNLVTLAVTPDGVLVALCTTAIYAVPGDGFDNFGGGQNYGPVRALSIDLGCRDHDSVATTPAGVVFQSSKGKYLLTRGLSLEYIGAPVADYDSETVLATHVDESLHQVRWLTGSRMLVMDYGASPPQWFEWTISGGVHAVIWNGTHHYLTAVGPYAQQTSHTGTSYGIVAETAWIKPADLQGAIRLRMMKILGEYRSAHTQLVEISYDYNTAIVDTKAWTATPTTVGGPLELEILPSRQQCQAVKVKVSVKGASTSATLATLTGLSDPVALVSPSGSWTATLSATPLGTLGNSVAIAIYFLESTTAAVKINNHAQWDGASGRWISATNTLGVLVTGNDTTARVTIATIEAAINTWSQLCQVSAAHASPSAYINFATCTGLGSITGTFGGGAFAAATGEACKLTGLALELGYQRGLFRRLPASQRA